MFFQKCCDDQVILGDIALDDGEYFCRRCVMYLGKTFQSDYRDMQNSIARKYKGYNPRNHASHVLNRLECIEKNKPADGQILQIKNKIDQGSGQYSKAEIDAVIKTPLLKKHIVYIWCKLNDVPFLNIASRDRDLLINKIVENKNPGKKIRKRYHELIREVILENPELEYISPYLIGAKCVE